MVVDRCHTEKTFAAGPAEPRHLNDDRYDLDKINKPDNRDKQRKAEHIGHTRDKSADCQRAGIPHEHFGRIGVIEEKAEKGSDHGRTCQYNAGSGCCRGYDKKECHRNGDAAAEAVHAIGKVGAVDCRNRDKDHDGNIKDPEIQHVPGHKRDPHAQRHVVDLLYIKSKQQRHQDLQQKLLPGKKSVRSLFHHFDIVVGKPDHSESECEDQNGNRLPMSSEWQKASDGQAQKDHQSSHIGGAGLF